MRLSMFKPEPGPSRLWPRLPGSDCRTTLRPGALGIKLTARKTEAPKLTPLAAFSWTFALPRIPDSADAHILSRLRPSQRLAPRGDVRSPSRREEADPARA